MTKFLWIPLFCIALIIQGCIQTETLDQELDNIISIETFQSPILSRAVVLENSQYPCIITDLCPPDIIKDATLTIEGEIAGRHELSCDTFIYVNELSTGFVPGEQVTLTVETAEKTFTATSIFPDSLNMVMATFYELNEPNRGLYLKIDTNLLELSDGLYIQFLTFSDRLPQFGFLITPESRNETGCSNNGCFIGPDVYYIPHSEINNSGILVFSMDQYLVSARNITSGSVAYYQAFKQTFPIGNFNVNNGLFFAPPNNLPTNFDNGGFGFFHLYYEQLVEGQVP